MPYAESRFLSAHGTTVTANYIYDGLERPALRTTQNMTPVGTTHYVYDLAGYLIAGATPRSDELVVPKVPRLHSAGSGAG